MVNEIRIVVRAAGHRLAAASTRGVHRLQWWNSSACDSIAAVDAFVTHHDGRVLLYSALGPAC